MATDDMADAAPADEFRAGAVDQLGSWLEATLNAAPLEPSQVPRKFSHGWRLTLDFSGTEMGLALLIDEQFPWTAPRVGLIDPPPFPSYPHVEQDGLICVLSHVDECDSFDFIGTAKHVITGALDILAQGLAGTNADEFRSEFLSYWIPGAVGRVTSILDPSEPSRAISVWPGKKWLLAADDPKSIRSWLSNRFDKHHVADSVIRRGLLLWLEQLPLPSEYPLPVDDVGAMATRAGVGPLFQNLLARSEDELLVIFGADTGHGIGFGAINLVRWRRASRHRKRLQSGGATLVRYAVERADAWWIHGRDRNDDVTTLRAMRVAMVGCGSLGSPIARLLAQAGVAQIDLIDPEIMEWANTGRHALGAESMPAGKAVQLAAQLSRSFPHSRFIGHADKWQSASEVLQGSDLIISTVGSWRAEGALNVRHLEGGLPPIIYAWAEPHGVASQAVALGHESGCFQCQLAEHGEPLARVVDWLEPTLRQEPACGAHFQPYGAPAIASAAALAADLALDVLLDRAGPAIHRIASARASVVEAAGGMWSAAWTARTGTGSEGGRIEEFQWLPNPSCRACNGNGLP